MDMVLDRAISVLLSPGLPISNDGATYGLHYITD